MTDERADASPETDLSLVIDGVDLLVAPLGGQASTEQLLIVKPRDAIDAYRELLSRYDRPRVVELGIAYGGSVALLALVARPRKLVAIDLLPDRVELLDRLIADRGLGDQIRLFYGTDQADRARVPEIVAEEFGDEPLDLVIDDASHLYDETVASFEMLFPRLRPGGEYVIEDWSCDHVIRDMIVTAVADPSSPLRPWAEAVIAGRIGSGVDQPPATAIAAESLGPDNLRRSGRRPLSRIAAQLALGPAEAGSGIESVTATSFWMVVRRNDLELEPGAFRLSQACPDHFGTFSD